MVTVPHQGKRALNRVGNCLTSEALPAALCPSSLPPLTAARLGTSPSAALRSRQGKKKKKKAYVVTAQAQASARAGPALEGAAGSEKGK